MSTYSEKPKELTVDHCALIYRPILNSPAGLHYGFLAVMQGEWRVIHLSKHGSPELVSLETFAAGEKWDIEESRILEKEVIFQRIEKALKEHSKYDILVNNCEDFARFIYNGKWRSHQTIISVGIVATGIYLALG